MTVFLIRGGALLAILPPFEGWDEYQHLARIAFVVEHGRSPVVNESKVPRSLYSAIAELPHSPFDVEQTQGVGARPYRTSDRFDPPIRSYWDWPLPSLNSTAGEIPLYQAQHGPFYYWIMTPVYKWLWDPGHPLTCIYTLRAINLALGGGAIVATLWTLSRLVSSARHRMWIALLLAVQPLFLLNVARIANDAAAVCLGIAASGLLLVYGRRGTLPAAIAAGVIAGLAVLSKSVALVILPLAVAAPIVGLWKRETTTLRAFMQVFLFFAVFFIVTGSYFYSNWKTYGVAVPMQESIRNQAQNRGLPDIIATIGEIDWWRQLRSRVTRDSLWVGGWSFLTLPAAFRGIHEGLIAIALAGFVVGFLARRRARANSAAVAESHQSWLDPASVALMAMIFAGALAGLGYHTLQSKLAYDTITTNVWYICLSFPWMIVLLVYAVNGFRNRTAAAWVGAMLLLCLIAECVGLFSVMTEGYTGLAWSAEAKARLASVHPDWLEPDLAIAFELTAIVLVIFVYVMSVRGMRLNPEHRLQPSVPQRDPAH